MSIHEQIRQLLAQGEKVYSFALGRVGQIVSVDANPLFPINLKSMRNHRTFATTFVAGDPVKLQEREEYKGEHCWVVVNIWPEDIDGK